MLREKTANSPLLLIRRALQLFALAASDKGAKLHSEKANTRTKGNISSHPFRGSFAALSRRSSQSKGAVRNCAKSRIKAGEKCSTSPVFSLFLSAFSENNAIHQSVSRGGDTKHLRQQRKHAHNRNCIRPTFHAKHATAQPADASFAHSRTPNLRVSPTLPPFRSCTKKTAIHRKMDSCLKEGGR